MVTYPQAEELLAGRLSEAGLEHSRRVAATARLLAILYGVDLEEARLAGLLHDWDRETPAAELLSASERLVTSEEDRRVPYLLHARTGAHSVSDAIPDLSEGVVSAIEKHTLGSEEMSDLDKVVYIADMIEPARVFEGVDDLREAVGTLSLEDLFALCYQQTMKHLVEARKVIHPDTVKIWNSMIARSER